MQNKKMSLTLKVLLGMLFGVVMGLIINYTRSSVNISIVTSIVESIYNISSILGKIFINMLKMLVVPLVLFSLIAGVLGIGDIKKLGKVGAKSFALYMSTTAIAITLGISLAIFFGIGENVNLSTTTVFSGKEAPALSEVFINIVPSNILKSMVNGEMLQIIFFAILLGVSILMLGKDAKSLPSTIETINKVMMKMVNIVMSLAPYAVFALMAKAIGDLGFDLLLNLLSYVLVLISALLLHLFGVLTLLLKIGTKLSPFVFLRKMREAQIFAFSTSSSNATIPVTLKTLTKKMGVKNSIASFTVPFGATINMDGTAIMQGVATVFIANAYGVSLGFEGYLTVIIMSVLASIGTAGVPGVGLIMLSMVFVQVGLPVEGIGILLGVDRLLDMVRTSVNVTGDAVVSIIVAKSEGEFNIDEYRENKS